MKELFLNKELSLKAKELGFDEPCFAYHTYKDKDFPFVMNWQPTKNSENPYHIAAPLYSQITDWLREEHNIHVSMLPFAYKWVYVLYNFPLDPHLTPEEEYHSRRPVRTDWEVSSKSFGERMGEYYEALNKGIEESFKLIQK